jgi:large subunit ribosomal protein L15
MKYNDLNISANKQNTRVGRGIAAGKGKTAGRGTKGQNSRAGGGVRPGFEGGQNPLMKRLPKLRGFRAIKPKAEVVYTSQLNNLGPNVDNGKLAAAKIISNEFVKVKVVLKGEISNKINLSTQGISDGALKLLEKSGGSFKKVDTPKRSKIKKS